MQQSLCNPALRTGNIEVATQVELVELPTGRILASFDVEPNPYPAGATKAGLVLNTEQLFDTGDGWMTEPGSEQVLIADADGSRTKIGPGSALAASADTIVRRVCNIDDLYDCKLFIGDVAKAVTPSWRRNVGASGRPNNPKPEHAAAANLPRRHIDVDRVR